MTGVELFGLVAALVVIAGVCLEWVRRRADPPDAGDWRFVPHWRAERLERLHVVDRDLEGLAELAVRTLLLEAHDREVDR